MIPSNKTKTKSRNTLANNVSTDIILSKTQLSKIIQSTGFLSAFTGKSSGSLVKVIVLLDENVPPPFSTIAAASARNGAV